MWSCGRIYIRSQLNAKNSQVQKLQDRITWENSFWKRNLLSHGNYQLIEKYEKKESAISRQKKEIYSSKCVHKIMHWMHLLSKGRTFSLTWLCKKALTKIFIISKWKTIVNYEVLLIKIWIFCSYISKMKTKENE